MLQIEIMGMWKTGETVLISCLSCWRWSFYILWYSKIKLQLSHLKAQEHKLSNVIVTLLPLRWFNTQFIVNFIFAAQHLLIPFLCIHVLVVHLLSGTQKKEIGQVLCLFWMRFSQYFKWTNTGKLGQSERVAWTYIHYQM